MRRSFTDSELRGMVTFAHGQYRPESRDLAREVLRLRRAIKRAIADLECAFDEAAITRKPVSSYVVDASKRLTRALSARAGGGRKRSA